MAIYTRAGDEGMTSLRGDQERVSKGGLRVSVIGSVDGLNSSLGVVCAVLMSFERVLEGRSEVDELEGCRERVMMVQGELFEIGAILARRPVSDLDSGRYTEELVWKKRVLRLEEWIDIDEEGLPELKNFILPGGNVAGANLLLARSVCRRTERELVRLFTSAGSRSVMPLFDKELVSYLNRLSDWLFVAGRRVNWVLGEEEVVWKGQGGERG